MCSVEQTVGTARRCKTQKIEREEEGVPHTLREKRVTENEVRGSATQCVRECMCEREMKQPIL